MKGVESSPMFQTISKIMSTAFNLILRPIGDFFSAVFKPISIVLMKWGAVNLRKRAESMQNNANEAMKTADMIGKSVVAFFADPLSFLSDTSTFLVKAITEGMYGVLYDLFGETIKGLMGWLGFKEEDIAKAITTPTFTAFDEFYEKINTKYGTVVDDLNKQLGETGGAIAAGAGVLSGINDSVKKVEEKMTMTDEVAEYMKNVIAPNMSEEKRAGYEAFAGTAWAKSDVGQATGLFDEEGELLKEELAIVGETLEESGTNFTDSAGKMTDDMSKQALKIQKETGVQSTYLGIASENAIASAITLEEGFKEIKRRLNALINAQITARTTKDKKGKADRDLIDTRDLIEENPTGLNLQNQLDKIKAGGRFEQATAGAFGVGVQDFQMMESLIKRYVGEDPSKRDWNNAKKLVKELSKLRGMGTKGADFLTFSNRWKNDAAYEGLSLEAAGAKYYGLASFANGGVISEPVFGIGRSGRSYLLGENGAEKISPMNGSSNDSVVVNINIAKMSSDVDLNQIKPIIERALLETHARRGII
jgi:hypothetical protein